MQVLEDQQIGCPDTAKSSRYNRTARPRPYTVSCPDTAKSSRYNLHPLDQVQKRSCPDTAKSSRYNRCALVVVIAVGLS